MPSFLERGYATQKKALQSGFIKEHVDFGIFELMTYHRFKEGQSTMHVYIEGDGRAWDRRNRLSADPTPSNPIALELAILDSADEVTYIARPGQFSSKEGVKCDPIYWSVKRFAPEVVEAFNTVIDRLKERSKSKRVELIGYSGGGALVILIAASRKDVVSIRTVAGNLNPKAFCAYHKVSQLEGSMDPLDVAKKVAHIPQRHFVGSKDIVVPYSMAESFVKEAGSGDCITIVEGVSHKGGWTGQWKELLLLPLGSSGKVGFPSVTIPLKKRGS